jgi:hypothetical protein
VETELERPFEQEESVCGGRIQPDTFLTERYGPQDLVEQAVTAVAIRHHHGALPGRDIGEQDAAVAFVRTAVAEGRDVLVAAQPDAEAFAQAISPSSITAMLTPGTL